MTRAATTSRIDDFFKEAYEQFRLNRKEERRGKVNQFYVDVPIRLSRGRMVSNDAPAGEAAELTNPLIFLTGVESPDAIPSENQDYADAPSISFIVGQYGLGKTELAFHVCHHMEKNSDVKPLPVNLALCRREKWKIEDEEKPAGHEFAELIFGGILEQLGLTVSFVYDELLPRIRRGEILLLLDGLDELVSKPEHHRNFFGGLMSFLMDGTSSADDLMFQVAISMRLEYLSSFALGKDAIQLVGRINPKNSRHPAIPVYFLVLDYLGDSHVRGYLNTRLGNKDAFEKVRTESLVLDILRRPLLLKLFCDTAGKASKKFDKTLNDLKKNANPATLIKLFVKNASEDASLKKGQQDLTDFTWDNEKLANTSLRLYRFGESAMKEEHIKEFLKPNQNGHTYEEIAKLDRGEVFKSIHKCPFLRHETPSMEDESGGVVRFAHRIFFEYFTAKAIADEVKSRRGEPTEERTRAFDELVLNVDMRKFLRGLMDEEVWFNETKKAYGLLDKDEWGKHISQERLDFLDTQRRELLKSMTDPERPLAGITETVEWFIKEEEECLYGCDRWLHPRYLIYNYEAIAVYLWYRRREAETKIIDQKFKRILGERLNRIINTLPEEESKLKKPYKLLIERILHIGQRLGYSWSRKFNNKEKQDELLSLIGPADQDITERIRDIFKDIQNS